MTSDRKHPTAAFWITVALVVVMAGYPLSIGPVQWLVGHGFVPIRIVPTLTRLYSPIGWIVKDGPEPIRSAMRWYVDLWL